ncbi:MAG: head-tail connector protein [Clostridia bacterium]
MVVTVSEVKAHLRIQYDEEDVYLSSLIAQAQAAAEDFCRVSFDGDAPEGQPSPEPVRLAVLLMVSHYYENRDNADKQVYITMRMAFENLLYPYRDVTKLF